MFDPEKSTKAIDWLLKQIFGSQIPVWAPHAAGWTILFALAVAGLWGGLIVLAQIVKLWQETFRPALYNEEERRRSRNRQRFADHIESEIRRLNNQEEWADYRFAELEAEVEAEGRRTVWGFFNGRSTIRREGSLSRALRSSRERIILLEGDPGTGKSVALRYVAQQLAKKAMRSRSLRSTIPIYVNLKNLTRQPGVKIDQNLIREFVITTINRINNRDISEFMNEEFDPGLANGTWLFLFDSFDETPEVLASTDVDRTVAAYADAIYSFLHGMNQCRGIVASRRFHGPKAFGWARFRILALSAVRCRQLVKKHGMNAKTEEAILGNLALARPEIKSMAGNPLFLRLICEHLMAGDSFPQTTHSVFESYVNNRLERDKERLLQRFKVDPASVRQLAEAIAFTMSAEDGLGLAPTREDLRSALLAQSFGVHPAFDNVLNALEFIRLARSEAGVSDVPTFTFAHRRFQEYFATCVVLRHTTRITSQTLITDWRWRETSVVMLQTQPLESLTPLLNMLLQLLAEACETLEADIIAISANSLEAKNMHLIRWPPMSRHLISIVQDGLSQRRDERLDNLLTVCSRLLTLTYQNGILLDKAQAVGLLGATDVPTTLELIRESLQSSSDWLHQLAFEQAGRLNEVPEDVATALREMLICQFANGILLRDQYAIKARLYRLPKPAEFLQCQSLLQMAYWVEIVTVLLLCAGAIVSHTARPGFIGALFCISQPYLVERLGSFALGTSNRTTRRSLWRSISMVFISRVGAMVMASGILRHGFMSGQWALNSWFTIVLGAFCLWTPAAETLVIIGSSPSRLFWPALPLYCACSLLNPKHMYSRISQLIRQRMRPVILFIASLVFASLVLVVIQRFLNPLSVILPWVFVISFSLIFLFRARHSVLDWITFRRWIKTKEKCITLQDLLYTISKCNTASVAVQWLEYSRSERCVYFVPDDYQRLGALILALHNKWHRSDTANNSISEVPNDECATVYSDVILGRFAEFGREFYEELNRTLGAIEDGLGEPSGTVTI